MWLTRLLTPVVIKARKDYLSIPSVLVSSTGNILEWACSDRSTQSHTGHAMPKRGERSVSWLSVFICSNV